MTDSTRKAAPRRRIPSYCEFATQRPRDFFLSRLGVTRS
jgi:hypothetical protein